MPSESWQSILKTLKRKHTDIARKLYDQQPFATDKLAYTREFEDIVYTISDSARITFERFQPSDPFRKAVYELYQWMRRRGLLAKKTDVDTIGKEMTEREKRKNMGGFGL